MRLIVLTQLFDPEPTFKGLSFVRALRERGYDVEVVTGFPNYPGGKVYDGYKLAPLTREVMDGIPVTRLAVYPSHDRNALRRMLCYGSFMMSSWFYLMFAARRYDVIYVFYPSLTAGLAAVAATVMRRVPIIVDIQDMWPDSLTATGMLNNKRILSFIDRLCRLLYRRVDHIMVLSPGFRSLLLGRGVPAEKISVHYNWTEEDSTEHTNCSPSVSLPDGISSTHRFRVIFAGNMGTAQGLDTVLDAAACVARAGAAIDFYLIGAGIEVDRLKERVVTENIGNVRFLPRVSSKAIKSYFAAADALLVNLRDDELFRITIPSKTQAYLFAGRPIIMAAEGDAAALVSRADAGITCKPGDYDALASAVMTLAGQSAERLAEMGRNGRAFYESELSFRVAIERFCSMVETVVPKAKQR